jgi:FlaA1/EpsC-like NDP-sugar epimerase
MTKLKLRNSFIVFGDLAFILASPILASIIRLELWLVRENYTPQIMTVIVLALLVKPLILSGFGIYRILWEYAELREYLQIFIASITSSLALAFLARFAVIVGLIATFPISLLSLDWLISLFGFLGLRLMMRLRRMRISASDSKPKA